MKKQKFLKAKSLCVSAIMTILLLALAGSAVSQTTVITVTAPPNGTENHVMCITVCNKVILRMPSWGTHGDSWELIPDEYIQDSIIITPANQGYWIFHHGTQSATILVRFVNPPMKSWSVDSTFTCGTLVGQTGAPVGTTYQWSNGLTSSSISVNQLGYYSVTVTSPSPQCPSESDTIKIVWAGTLPTIPLNGNYCAGIDTLMLWADGGPFTGYTWSTGSSDPQIVVANTGNYAVTVTNSMGCQTSDTTTLTFNSVPVVQPCYFSFDPPTQHNQATWPVESPPIADSVRYMIRDTSGFVPVATVAYNVGNALDTTTFPQSQYYEYCLQAKLNTVNCGWSAFSNIHRTIMLSVTQFGSDVTLSWWQYIAPGVNITNYSIWAIDNMGIHHLITTVTALSGLNGYIYANAPGNYVKYYITFNLPCSSKGVVKSPIIAPTVYTGIEEFEDTNNVISINVYPNPCTTFINIEGAPESSYLYIYDMNGRAIWAEKTTTTTTTVNLESLPSATYIIGVIANNKLITKQIIKTD